LCSSFRSDEILSKCHSDSGLTRIRMADADERFNDIKEKKWKTKK